MKMLIALKSIPKATKLSMAANVKLDILVMGFPFATIFKNVRLIKAHVVIIQLSFHPKYRGSKRRPTCHHLMI